METVASCSNELDLFSQIFVGNVSLFESSSKSIVSHLTLADEYLAFLVILTNPLYDAFPPFLPIDLDKILLLVCFPKCIILAPVS